MPCSDHGAREFYAMRYRLSDALYCLDELNGDSYDREDNHPIAEAIKGDEEMNEKLQSVTDRLCRTLGAMKNSEISAMSLELQRWWINHQISDRELYEARMAAQKGIKL